MTTDVQMAAYATADAYVLFLLAVNVNVSAYVLF